MVVRRCLVLLVDITSFLVQGCIKGTVGVFIAKRWMDSVVNEQMMYVKLVIGKQIVNIVCLCSTGGFNYFVTTLFKVHETGPNLDMIK